MARHGGLVEDDVLLRVDAARDHRGRDLERGAVQLRRLLIRVNEVRRAAGLSRIDASVLRTKRKTVRPFELPGTGATSVPFGWDSV